MKVNNFNLHFPILSRIINNIWIYTSILLIITLVLLAAQDYISALSLFCINLSFLTIYLDRSYINKWPITPSFWFAAVLGLSGGLGPILVKNSNNPIIDGIVQMQISMIVGYSFFILTYILCKSKSDSVPEIRLLVNSNNKIKQSLIGGGLLALLFGLASVIVGSISGALDRGSYGEEADYQVFGYWTYFLAFINMSNAGFILLPFILKHGSIISKLICIACFITIIPFTFLTGSRQALFVPFICIGIGYLGLLYKSKIKLELLIILFIPIAAFLFVFLQYFRDTKIFHEESLANPIKKAQAISEARFAGESSDTDGKYIIGSRLIGTVDTLIFQQTPSVIPHAYFENFESIIWLYIPYFLYPNRPIMQDGKFIGEQYLGTILRRTSISSSLTGDVYRRFGWAGLIFGMSLVGIYIGLYSRFIFFLISKGFLYPLALLLVFSVFVLKDANMTILQGLWWTLYDVPKQAFLLYIFFIIGRIASPILTK